jgi:hypothetical protein
VTERSKPDLVPHASEAIEEADEPPVVARLVVEIRSDGTRTIARGAIEDAQRGERVAIEARGDSPGSAGDRACARTDAVAAHHRTVGSSRTSRKTPR